MVPGVGLDLRGTAARQPRADRRLDRGGLAASAGSYVRTIQDSIHRHRLDTERMSTCDPGPIGRRGAERQAVGVRTRGT